jgi:tRNA(adenine34) deaminase
MENPESLPEGSFRMNFMQLALRLAREALSIGIVPVGAIITRDNCVIAQSRNGFDSNDIPNSIRHAEIGAIVNACQKLEGDRLDGSEIYVTLEPCAMCFGAIELVRIRKVVFGAYSSSVFSCQSRTDHIAAMRASPFSGETIGGIMEADCADLMCQFFKGKRGVLSHDHIK